MGIVTLPSERSYATISTLGADFEAISALLNSYRQKGIDRYGENMSGPLIGHQSVAANVVGANAATP